MSRFALAALLCVVPELAAANPYLDEGRRLYAQLQYAQAIAQLRVAREVPNATRAERLEAMDLLARCLVAEGQRDEAGRLYADLLTLAPDAQLEEGLSPKIKEVFNEAKQRLYPDGYTAMRALPAAPGTARFEVLDPWRRISRVVVHVRRAEAWTQLSPQSKEGSLHASLHQPGAEASAWYAEAFDEAGAVIAHLGSRSAPFAEVRPELVRAPPAPPPLPERKSDARLLAGGVAVTAAVLAGTAGGVMQYRSGVSAKRARDPDVWVDEGAAWHARADSDAKWAAGLFIGSGAAAVTAVVLFAW